MRLFWHNSLNSPWRGVLKTIIPPPPQMKWNLPTSALRQKPPCGADTNLPVIQTHRTALFALCSFNLKKCGNFVATLLAEPAGGQRRSVGRSVPPVLDWSSGFSSSLAFFFTITTTGWIAMKLGINIECALTVYFKIYQHVTDFLSSADLHGPHIINPSGFGDFS